MHSTTTVCCISDRHGVCVVGGKQIRNVEWESRFSRWTDAVTLLLTSTIPASLTLSVRAPLDSRASSTSRRSFLFFDGLTEGVVSISGVQFESDEILFDTGRYVAKEE